MKKHFILLLILSSLTSWCGAQNNDLEAVSSSGGDTTVQGYQISWTIGEGSIHTQKNSDYRLTQGLQQPDFLVSTLVKAIKEPATFNLYPNPADDLLYIHFKDEQSYIVDMYDNTGRWIGRFQGPDQEGSISVKALPPGRYYMRLTNVKPRKKPEWASFLVFH